MPDEEKAVPSLRTRITQRILWEVMQQTVALSLLILAMIEALFSPFFGWHLAVASIAVATVAIGLILANGAVGIQCVGGWVQELNKQVQSLREEEMKKQTTETQQRAEPEKPLPNFKIH